MNSIAFNGLSLQGLTALVTGAGRGIGRGCAELIAARGAHVVAVARSADEVESLCKDIKAAGGSCEGQAVDVTDTQAMRRMIAGLDRLDILLNNAGTNAPQSFLDVDEETFDRIMGLNVRAAFLVAQSAAQRMVAQGSGTIIFMSSQMGHVGGANRTVYCASKHAIEGLTKAMAVELGPRGLRINAVGPTFVETPMTRPYLKDEAFMTDVQGRIPLGRLGSIEDVAEAVCYLASPAAAMVNGHSLLVDGGWTAH